MSKNKRLVARQNLNPTTMHRCFSFKYFCFYIYTRYMNRVRLFVLLFSFTASSSFDFRPQQQKQKSQFISWICRRKKKERVGGRRPFPFINHHRATMYARKFNFKPLFFLAIVREGKMEKKYANFNGLSFNRFLLI